MQLHQKSLNLEMFPSEQPPPSPPPQTPSLQLSLKGAIEHSPSGQKLQAVTAAHRRKARRSGMRSGEGQQVVRHKDSKARKEERSELGHGAEERELPHQRARKRLPDVLSSNKATCFSLSAKQHTFLFPSLQPEDTRHIMARLPPLGCQRPPVTVRHVSL